MKPLQCKIQAYILVLATSLLQLLNKFNKTLMPISLKK